MSDVEVVIKNKNSLPIGLVEKYTSLETISKFNDIGTWSMSLPGNEDVWDALFKTRAYIEVFEDGVSVFTGLVRKSKREEGANVFNMEFSGYDLNSILNTRIIYPETDGLPFDTDEYFELTGYAEVVMKNYVYYSLGTGAIVTRRYSPSLSLAPTLNIGYETTEQARLDNLLTFLQDVASRGGGLGFYMNGYAFTVYMPEDKSNEVVFSMELGNLLSYSYTHEVATANAIIVGGQNEGTARVFKEVTDSQSIVNYGRLESFLDRRGIEDEETLISDGNAELEKQKEKSTLTLEPTNSGSLVYNRDYFLGDTVKVFVKPGVVYTDVIREVKKTYSSTSKMPTIVPTISTPEYYKNNPFSNLFANMRMLDSRINNLERR